MCVSFGICFVRHFFFFFCCTFVTFMRTVILSICAGNAYNTDADCHRLRDLVFDHVDCGLKHLHTSWRAISTGFWEPNTIPRALSLFWCFAQYKCLSRCLGCNLMCILYNFWLLSYEGWLSQHASILNTCCFC